MTTYGVTATGFVKKDAATILDELIAEYKAIHGENINTGPGSKYGNEIGARAERESLLWDLGEAVYLSSFRNTSTGQSLDATGALIGKARIEASYSTVTLTLATIGNTDVTVPSGSTVKQSTINVEWDTTAEATIPAAVTVLEDLDINNINWQSGNTIRYTFSGTPDLSSVAIGDAFYASGCTNSSNNGLFITTAVNNGSDYVEVINETISDNAADEAGSAGTGVLTDGVITVAARSALEGAYAANFGTIDAIVTPVTGWDYIANLEDAETGTDQESDADFRVRMAASTTIAIGSTAEAIKQQILQVDGVTYCQVEQNRTGATVNGIPAYGIKVTVVGGTNQAVINALGLALAVGTPTTGATSATYTDEQNISETLYIQRVTEVDLYFDVTLTTTAAYPSNGDALVKQAIADYIGTLSHGDDVINLQVILSLAGIAGITAATILQSTTDPPAASSDITISSTQLAVVDQANIDVTS